MKSKITFWLILKLYISLYFKIRCVDPIILCVDMIHVLNILLVLLHLEYLRKKKKIKSS